MAKSFVRFVLVLLSPINFEYTFDPSGNLVQRHSASTSSTATVADFTCLYDAFGQQLGCVDRNSGTQATDQDTVGFSGQFGGWTDNETDAVQAGAPRRRFPLVRMGYRDYAPLTGRFVERDPIDYAGGINLYAYAGNNPITHADPSGLTEGWDLFFIAYDLYLMGADAVTHAPTATRVLNNTAFGIDVGLALIPFVPTGGGHALAMAGGSAMRTAARTVPMEARAAQAVVHFATVGQGNTHSGGSSSSSNRQPFAHNFEPNKLETHFRKHALEFGPLSKR